MSHLKITKEEQELRIALLPGSRSFEVRRNLGSMCAGVREALRCTGQAARMQVPWRLNSPPPSIPGVEFVREAGPSVLERSDLALVAAGTATLEAAALGVPTVITAAAHPVSALLARRFLNTPFLGLPNILLQERVITELHQDLTPAKISAALAPLIANLPAAKTRAEKIRQRLHPILGAPGLGARAASYIEPMVCAYG